MRHPNSDTRNWPLIWFAKYSLHFCLPLVLLLLVFLDKEWWFLGLSAYLFSAVIFFAWRAANERVSTNWRIGLGAVLASSWVYTLLLVYAEPGDTKICWPRVVKPHLWETPKSIGPDPYCQGTRLEDVEIG